MYKLAYFGNEFAIPEDRVARYERAYVGPDAASARDALERRASRARISRG